VIVLDRAPVGTEASGWALGRLDPLLKGSGSTGTTEKDLPDGHIAKPAAQQEFALLSYRLHRELTPAIQETSGIDIQVDDQPTLQLFYSEADRNSGQQTAAHWTSLGFNTEILTATEIRKIDARFSSPEHGGALVEGPYFIDSLRFVTALAACARSAGVRIESATVTRIDAASGPVATVHTDQGHYEAATVVVAAGPWSNNPLKPLGVNLPVHPSKGEILRLAPPSTGEFATHLHGPCSLVNKKDGMVWVAATAADVGFDRTPSNNARERLLANANLMMPDAGKSEVLQHTVCFRPATPDDLPVVGRAGDSGNVVVATGGGGSGIMQCLYVGKVVEAMLAGDKDEPALSSISLGRFA
jgi:glycine oxidase